MQCSLNFFYTTIGKSKQSVHKYLNRYMHQKSMEHQVLYMVSKVRENHPVMALRDIYFKIQPDNMGRDKFEALCKKEGLGVKQIKNYRRTTNSNGVIRFDNLII